MKKIVLVIGLFAVLMLFSGCSDSLVDTPGADVPAGQVYTEEDKTQSSEESLDPVDDKFSDQTVYPLTITDSYGREVTIEKKPESVISIAPSITETIFAIGAENILKGRTDYCTYPQAAEKIASIGSMRNPSIEAIAALGPDLVIASTHFKEETLAKLEDIGIKVVVLSSQNSFEGVYEVIENTGRILNQNKESRDLILSMKAKVETVLKKTAEVIPTEVYYVVGFGERGDHTAGGDTFISQMIEMAGGTNAAAEVKGWSYSLEKLIEKDPYMMVCSVHDNSKRNIQATNGYQDLTSVKEGRLYEIDDDLLDIQGPRLAQGLEALAKILHPEVFE